MYGVGTRLGQTRRHTPDPAGPKRPSFSAACLSNRRKTRSRIGTTPPQVKFVKWVHTATCINNLLGAADCAVGPSGWGVLLLLLHYNSYNSYYYNYNCNGNNNNCYYWTLSERALLIVSEWGSQLQTSDVPCFKGTGLPTVLLIYKSSTSPFKVKPPPIPSSRRTKIENGPKSHQDKSSLHTTCPTIQRDACIAHIRQHRSSPQDAPVPVSTVAATRAQSSQT